MHALSILEILVRFMFNGNSLLLFDYFCNLLIYFSITFYVEIVLQYIIKPIGFMEILYYSSINSNITIPDFIK